MQYGIKNEGCLKLLIFLLLVFRGKAMRKMLFKNILVIVFLCGMRMGGMVAAQESDFREDVDVISPLYSFPDLGGSDVQQNSSTETDQEDFFNLVQDAGSGADVVTKVAELLDKGTVNIDALDQINRTALSYALAFQNQDLATLLVNKKAHVNDESAEKLFFLYVAQNNPDMVRKVIDAFHVDVDSLDRLGWTGLVWAAHYGNIEVINVLINARANVNKVVSSSNGYTTALMEAVKQNKLEAVKLLLKFGANPTITTPDGQNALSWAKRGTNKELVSLLSGVAASVSELSDKESFFLAIKKGGDAKVNELISSHKVDVDMGDEKGRLPLFLAIRFGRPGIVKLLLENHAKIDAVDADGNSALDIALIARYLIDCNVSDQLNKIFTDLLEVGVILDKFSFIENFKKNNNQIIDLLNEAGARAREPIVNELFKGYINAKNVERVTQFVNNYNIDVNAPDMSGNTPLMYACATGDPDMVKLLLKMGANPGEGDVVAMAHANLIDVLFDAGKPLDDEKIKKIFLLYVAENKPESLGKLLQKHSAAISGADLSTALIKAIDNNSTELVDVLLNAGADPRVRRLSGETALSIAANNGREDIVDRLIEGGANSIEIDKNGRTALERSITAIDYGPLSKNLETLLKRLSFVDKQLQIPAKSCFISFESDDHNNAITKTFLSALTTKVVCIVSGHVMQKLISAYPVLENVFEQNKWTVFLSNTGQAGEGGRQNDLFVVIPATVNGAAELLTDYGITNCEHIQANEVIKKIKSIRPHSRDQDKDLIKNFGLIIDHSPKSSEKRLANFYLMGHGVAGSRIADIPLEDVRLFLITLAEIKAQFLYINSCYAGGKNLIDLQNYLQDVINFKREQWSLGIGSINYAIAIQATSDVATGTFTNLHEFFNRLNRFMLKPLWAFQKARQQKRDVVYIEDVIEGLLPYRFATDLVAIRFPGKMSSFRTIEFDDVKKITWLMVQALKASGSHGDRDKKVDIASDKTKYITVFPCDVPLTINIMGMNTPKFISKISGPAAHFIDKIECSALNEAHLTPERALKEFLKKSFVNVFGNQFDAAEKFWFINELAIHLKGGDFVFEEVEGVVSWKPLEDANIVLKNICIKISPKLDVPSGIYKAADVAVYYLPTIEHAPWMHYVWKCSYRPEFLCTDTDAKKVTDPQQELTSICQELKAEVSEKAIAEATGGNETKKETVLGNCEKFAQSMGYQIET